MNKTITAIGVGGTLLVGGALLMPSEPVNSQTIQVFDDGKTSTSTVKVLIKKTETVEKTEFSGTLKELQYQINSLKAQRDKLNEKITYYEGLKSQMIIELNKLPVREVRVDDLSSFNIGVE